MGDRRPRARNCAHTSAGVFNRALGEPFDARHVLAACVLALGLALTQVYGQGTFGVYGSAQANAEGPGLPR